MFAWQVKPSPPAWPANGDAARAGVRRDVAARVDDGDLAERRPASSAATSARERRRAALARLPARSSSARAVGGLGDRLRRDRADARRAPTGTIEPTENQCDWTATPSSPVAGSRATIE